MSSHCVVMVCGFVQDLVELGAWCFHHQTTNGFTHKHMSEKHFFSESTENVSIQKALIST